MQIHEIEFKQVTNRNNSYIKPFRYKEIDPFLLSLIIVGITTLDPDKSYLVNFFQSKFLFILYFVFVNN